MHIHHLEGHVCKYYSAFHRQIMKISLVVLNRGQHLLQNVILKRGTPSREFYFYFRVNHE